MPNKHLYLFALEITPLEVSSIRDELPLHCTLMHRFWSELAPDALAEKVRPFLEQIPQQDLIAEKHTLLGPKKMPVSELELTNNLKNLHIGLYKLLNDLVVEYTAPEWVGDDYRAHVSDREDDKLTVGNVHVSKAIYLIEVNVPGHEHKRLVRAKFDLGRQ